MNAKTILIGILILLVLGGMWTCSKRNQFVSKKEEAKAQWQQVQTQYQRRMDLIPNIVSTVKAQANFEKTTLEEVINARAKATQITINAENLDDASMEKFKKAQGELSGALSRLLAVAENYPELRTNQAFSELRTELEGTENRISVQRMKYNELVKDYNKSIQFFPGNIVASLFGFTPMPYFEAEAGAEKAPNVGKQLEDMMK
ncbi:MAG: LemA family protein [Bacteroidia bacterium]|nr:LemA family protein [Bacteroidia bacterium]